MPPLLSLAFSATLAASSPSPACTPDFCDPEAHSTPARVARLETALGRLHAIHPSLADQSSKVHLVLVPQVGPLGGFFDPEHRIVAVREEADECEVVVTLGHELTHVRRLGVGPDSAAVAPRQKTAEEFVDFMLVEEGWAFIAEIRTAEAMGCADDLPSSLRGLAARFAGHSDEEAMAIFLGVAEFVEPYRTAYKERFERQMRSMAAAKTGR